MLLNEVVLILRKWKKTWWLEFQKWNIENIFDELKWNNLL